MEGFRLFRYQGRGVGILSVRGLWHMNWFDTVTRGRSVGSLLLAWVPVLLSFLWHAPYPITEEMRIKSIRLEQQQKERKGTMNEILARNSGLRDRRVVTPVLVWDLCPVIRSDQRKSSRTTFPQRHFGVTSTPCPTCGKLHIGACFGDSRVPSAPVRQLGGSSGRGSRVAQQSGRGSAGRGQAQARRGQARVFAMTRQDAQASNAVVTGILPICSRDDHVLFDPRAPHSFVSLSFATQLVSIGGKELFANLIALDMVDFDGDPRHGLGEQGWAPHNLLSALGASKLVRKGLSRYLALVRDTTGC
ncbi:Retroviral aspartyl protease [Sesbania bispinosa]|nr:Retroviral aspartyl protease [Sesbania bispinosa]